MQGLDQQNRQVAILSSEIRQMERDKRTLASDIERLNISKKAAFAEAQGSAKDLTKRSEQLTVKIAKLREECELLQKEYDDTVQLNKEYPIKARRDADQILADAKQTADNMEHSALAIKEEVAAKLQEAKAYEERLTTWQAEIEQHEQDLLQLEGELKRDRQQWADAENVRLSTKLQKEEEVAILTHQIAGLHEAKEALTLENRSLQNRIIMDQQALNKRTQDLQLCEQAIANRSRMLDQRTRTLDEANILLKDRQGQLDRAITEWKQKGVVLNG